MKRLSLLLIACCIVTTFSCTKEAVTTGANSQVAEVASMNSITSDQLTATGTHFGAGFDNLSTDQKITVLKKLGANYVRARVIVSTFDGHAGSLEKFSKNGIHVILNLNWEETGNNPKSFPQDMATYRKKLGNVLDKYKPEVAVIENEPTNQIYYKGPMSDYITELKNAIDVCKQHGVKVADGCVHVATVQDVMNGGSLSDAASRAKQLLDAYKTLDLDYVTVHAPGSGDSYPSQDLVNVANYIRNHTGKQVISNEFKVYTNSTSLLRDMVQGMKQGNYIIALLRSASGATRLNDGTDLNSLGRAYADAIK
jgi:hypothetical protein